MKTKALLVFILLLCKTSLYSQDEIPPKKPIFSTLHTLSIHIKNPAVHDSVFHFLSDKLQLPVYYQPLTIGDRKYAGVYAGNLVLEPCGPYSEFKYATNDFKAIFFGLTFEPAQSIASTAKILQQKGIQHEVGGEEFIFFKDSLLCGDNIYVSIMDKHEKEKDHLKFDSLRLALNKNTMPGLGIEYVKEVQIRYTSDQFLDQWQKLNGAMKLRDSKVWKLNNELVLQFIPGKIREVKSIVFKVKSLEKAKKYLTKNNISFTQNPQNIQLDKSGTFGLTIFLDE